MTKPLSLTLEGQVVYSQPIANLLFLALNTLPKPKSRLYVATVHQLLHDLGLTEGEIGYKIQLTGSLTKSSEELGVNPFDPVEF